MTIVVFVVVVKAYFPFDENGKSKPQVLVIDQFEELFTFYPDNTWRKQQENFFEQIAKALESAVIIAETL